MRAPLWFTCLIWACATNVVPRTEMSAPNHGLAFRVIEVSREPRLVRPAFFGPNAAAASQLNAWVAEQWHDDHGCAATKVAAGTYTRELTVLRLTPLVAVFVDSGDASCPNTAHPSTWAEQYVVEIASGQVLDVWEGLSAASRERLRKQVSAFGLHVRKGDECAELYQIDQLPERLLVAFADGTVRVEPSFGYAARACVEPLSIPIERFKQQFETEGRLHRVLETW